MECGVLISLQHGVDMHRAIRYAIVRGAIQKSLSEQGGANVEVAAEEASN
jgi:hypothetical protein